VWKAFDWATMSERARIEESRERQVKAVMESDLTEEQKSEMIGWLGERWAKEEEWAGMMRTVFTMIPLVIGAILVLEIVRRR